MSKQKKDQFADFGKMIEIYNYYNTNWLRFLASLGMTNDCGLG